MTAGQTITSSGRWTRMDLAALAVIATVWIVMILAIRPVGEFPLNDDWIYAGAVKSILAGDGFRIPGPTIANVVGQVIWGLLFCLPFGFSYTALRVSTFVLGFGGLCALYGLVRDAGGGRRVASAAALALAVDPLYFAPAASFMTDVPFLALMIAALWALSRSLRDGSTLALAAGVLMSFAAILVRQTGVVPLLAYGLVHAVQQRRRPLRIAAGFIPVALGLLLHLAYQRWLTASGRGAEVYFEGVGQLVPWDIRLLMFNATHNSLYILPYLGFSLLPVVVLTGIIPRGWLPPRMTRIALPVVIVGCAGALLVLWKQNDLVPFIGNVILPSGIGPLTQKDTWLLRLNLPRSSGMSTLFWLAVTGTGLAGAVALVLVTARGLPRRVAGIWRGLPEPGDNTWLLMLITAAGYWTVITLLVTRYGSFFDRYILPLTPIGLVLLVLGGGQPVTTPRFTAAVAILLCVGTLTTFATADYIAWNRTRWSVLNHLTRDLGVAPDRIDGGYEFNGSLLFTPGYRPPPGKSYWWVHDDEYVLASGPLPGYQEVERRSFDRWLPGGIDHVAVLKRQDGSR